MQRQQTYSDVIDMNSIHSAHMCACIYIYRYTYIYMYIYTYVFLYVYVDTNVAADICTYLYVLPQALFVCC